MKYALMTVVLMGVTLMAPTVERDSTEDEDIVRTSQIMLHADAQTPIHRKRLTIEFVNMSLRDILRDLETSIVPMIDIEWPDGFWAAQKWRDRSTLTMQCEACELGHILDLVTAEMSTHTNPMDWILVDDVIYIDDAREIERRASVTRLYGIHDLVASIQESDRLMSWGDAVEMVFVVVQEHVSPDDWNDLGGDIAAATYINGKLVIAAPDSMHVEIAWLLRNLRSEQSGELAMPSSMVAGSADCDELRRRYGVLLKAHDELVRAHEQLRHDRQTASIAADGE